MTPTTTKTHFKLYPRFTATAEQLRLLRDQINRYVAAIQRERRQHELQARREAGEALMAAQSPECRLDYTIARIEAAVTAIMIPPLPDALGLLDAPERVNVSERADTGRAR